jgi:hypothetical protein
MDVGFSMMLTLREWNVFQGVLLLLSTLTVVLDRIVEYVVPAEPKFGSGRTVAVTVSTPIRSFGSRLNARESYRKGRGWSLVETGALRSSNNTFILSKPSLGIAWPVGLL